MKRCIIFTGLLALVMSLAGMVGCEEAESESSGFNLEFRYGVTAGNILNTFEGTYTKDMVLDPAVTTNLRLTETEMDSIYQKMVEIDFFRYPDVFKVDVHESEVIGIITPYSTYYFEVEYPSGTKELKWEDEITNTDEKADKLRELIELIINIIESKAEYQVLPAPSGGYL